MTKEEILAMEAGLELDRLIEVYIFGHQDAKVVKEYSSVWVGSIPSPFYSTDISAAWRVKERLNSEGLLLILADLRPGEALCRAEFWNSVGLPSSTIAGQATTNSTPEAICKAALLAKLESNA